MSPLKLQDSEVITKGVINGQRPLPLKINKESHAIHKSSSRQSVIENSGQSLAPKQGSGGVLAKRQPVIIYTHSPKVIHAQASDFMALVQKLTGLSDDDGKKTVKSEMESMKEEVNSFSHTKNYVMNNNFAYGDNEISSVLMDGRFMGEMKENSSSISPMYRMSNTYLVDAQLFTPGSNDFFCQSRSKSLPQSPNKFHSI